MLKNLATSALLYDFITESHVICTADGITFADYE
jgi:hypothetical protein